MHIYIYIWHDHLFWLSLAAAAIEAATPPGVVLISGLFLISAPITPSASSRVTALSAGNFSVASYSKVPPNNNNNIKTLTTRIN